MQRASDAVAALAILVGAAGSFAFTSLVCENRSSEPVRGIQVPNASAHLDGVLRIPLPPVDHREIRVGPGQLRVMHVPTVLRSGGLGAVGGTHDVGRGLIIEFVEAPAPGLLIEGEDQTRERKRHKRKKREKRKKRRRRGSR